MTTGLGTLPAGVSWRAVTGVALLAGIGFTVSLFITGLAFEDPALRDAAKLGVLGASILAGCLGSAVLRRESRERGEFEPEVGSAVEPAVH